MNSHKQNHDQNDALLYLLGELSLEDTGAFERQLAVSPELGEELQRQADLIVSVAATGIDSASTSPSVVVTDGGSRCDEGSRWPWVASALAVAVCLALVVVGVRFSEPDNNSVARLAPPLSDTSTTPEALLIARAWANSRTNEVPIDTVYSDSEFDDTLAFSTADDSTEIDSALSWMFVAVSADLAPATSEGANDG